MKLLTSIIALGFSLSWAGAFDHSQVNEIFKTYVNDDGLVNYSDLKANRSELDSYLKKTGAVTRSSFDGWNQSEQLAFLINVYNAETLQFIIDNYPTSSIKKLGGLISTPWDKKNVDLFGEVTTLNHLEHRIVRKEFDEPRIHFALVCAAVGCPPLRNEAFTAENLEAQLDDQAKTFLSQSEKNRVEGDTLYLSTIFQWYGGDFTKDGNSIDVYVDAYMDGDASGKKIKHTDYDWNLNDQK
tara:strand:+ start:2862 stop:3584 length:723 start_codon:yes stop_codon:yes gene_type:complete